MAQVMTLDVSCSPNNTERKHTMSSADLLRIFVLELDGGPAIWFKTPLRRFCAVVDILWSGCCTLVEND